MAGSQIEEILAHAQRVAVEGSPPCKTDYDITEDLPPRDDFYFAPVGQATRELLTGPILEKKMFLGESKHHLAWAVLELGQEEGKTSVKLLRQDVRTGKMERFLSYADEYDLMPPIEAILKSGRSRVITFDMIDSLIQYFFLECRQIDRAFTDIEQWYPNFHLALKAVRDRYKYLGGIAQVPDLEQPSVILDEVPEANFNFMTPKRAELRRVSVREESHNSDNSRGQPEVASQTSQSAEQPRGEVEMAHRASQNPKHRGPFLDSSSGSEKSSPDAFTTSSARNNSNILRAKGSIPPEATFDKYFPPSDDDDDANYPEELFRPVSALLTRTNKRPPTHDSTPRERSRSIHKQLTTRQTNDVPIQPGHSLSNARDAAPRGRSNPSFPYGASRPDPRNLLPHDPQSESARKKLSRRYHSNTPQAQQRSKQLEKAADTSRPAKQPESTYQNPLRKIQHPPHDTRPTHSPTPIDFSRIGSSWRRRSPSNSPIPLPQSNKSQAQRRHKLNIADFLDEANQLAPPPPREDHYVPHANEFLMLKDTPQPKPIAPPRAMTLKNPSPAKQNNPPRPISNTSRSNPRNPPLLAPSNTSRPAPNKTSRPAPGNNPPRSASSSNPSRPASSNPPRPVHSNSSRSMPSNQPRATPMNPHRPTPNMPSRPDTRTGGFSTKDLNRDQRKEQIQSSGPRPSHSLAPPRRPPPPPVNPGTPTGEASPLFQPPATPGQPPRTAGQRRAREISPPHPTARATKRARYEKMSVEGLVDLLVERNRLGSTVIRKDMLVDMLLQDDEKRGK